MTAADAGLPTLPKRYVAAKFYFRESLPDTPANRAAITKLLLQMAQQTDVVLFSTTTRVDDHSDFSFANVPGVHVVDPMSDPAQNLKLQTRLLAGAEAFVGTYGGLTYIANYLGKTSICFEVDAEYNRPMHTEFAHRKLRPFGGRLHLLHPNDIEHFERLFAARSLNGSAVHHESAMDAGESPASPILRSADGSRTGTGWP
jgi:ADP-heptose:LPS heptosyltransferase